MAASSQTPRAPRAPNLEALSIALARAIVAASLAEIDPGEACDLMCAALAQHAGVRCELLDGHRVDDGADSDRYLLGNAIDGNAATLLLSPKGALDDPTRTRIERLFVLLVQIALPVPQMASVVHQLRNCLTGLQTNLELVQMIAPAAYGPDGTPANREDTSIALGHALQACREMTEAIRSLGGQRFF